MIKIVTLPCVNNNLQSREISQSIFVTCPVIEDFQIIETPTLHLIRIMYQDK